MPTYEYECKECRFRFEKFQSIKDEPLSVCPKCKGSLRRLIGSGLGIIFKGSGFYSTDYKKSSFQADSGDNNSSQKKNPEKKSDTEKAKAAT
ncbi:MAG: zinc ribbon domain-containing protein [Spirochaetales bacterium]|nr:zinc ribbon domain-containing protein [Spirochaetales bacterium]